jgi:ankyrin repeat protein
VKAQPGKELIVNPSLPTRPFRGHTDLDQLKRQARELLEAFRAKEAAAVAEVNAHYRDPDPATFALHDAQMVLARAYGFASWPKLKAYVDGITVKQWIAAVRAGDLEKVRAMLRARPELVNMGADEHCAIHYAVLNRSVEMTRVLMQNGADPRSGIHPHRDATTALTIATERGYDDIVAIMRVEEQRRREANAGSSAAAAPDALFLVANWRSGRALEMLKADPTLVHSASPNGGTPLHAAACELHERGVAWLLEHGADPNQRIKGTWTPIELAATRKGWDDTDHPAKFRKVAKLLLRRGAQLGPFSAIALGDADWIRARHAEGALVNPAATDHFVGHVGLLETAIWHDRPEILTLLLDLGLDPNERMRVGGTDEIIYSAGGPLFCCVIKNERRIAQTLLAGGADPNANVFTSGSPLYKAYEQKKRSFIKLLEQHGGFLDAISAGFARQTEAAKKLLADEVAGRLRPGAVSPGKTVAEDLLWTAAGGGDAKILRLALERIGWPRQGSRWLYPLWQAFTCDGGVRRGLACFRLLLDRADPNQQSESGRTMLHTVVASGQRKDVPFARMLLDAGARTDLRDELLKSTPLGWACRWGRVHFVKLLLDRGADPVETDAESWATPTAWAQKMKHDEVLKVLREHGG